MDIELLKKAREAESPEELLKLAHENGIEDFTDENAKAYFEAMHRSGELADEEIDVSAGGCKKGGKTVVTHLNRCDEFICKSCGRYMVGTYDGGFAAHGAYIFGPLDCNKDQFCCNCKYFIYESGLWLCNNPKHNGQ